MNLGKINIINRIISNRSDIVILFLSACSGSFLEKESGQIVVFLINKSGKFGNDLWTKMTKFKLYIL